MCKNNTHPVGELLAKLCDLSRSHNVEIRIKQSVSEPNKFEVQLDPIEQNDKGE